MTEAGDATGDASPVHSLESYYAFLRALRDASVSVTGFRGVGSSLHDGSVVLRHDVVLSLERALATARVEAAVGVTGTYFVLVSGPLYAVAAPRGRQLLTRIAALDHEVGLLFDPRGRWRDPPLDDAVADAIGADRRVLSAVTDPVETVSILGTPDWVYGEQIDGVRHADEPRFVVDVTRRSDAAGSAELTADSLPAAVGATQVVVHPGLVSDGGASLDAAFDRAIQGGTAGARSFVDHVERTLRSG